MRRSYRYVEASSYFNGERKKKKWKKRFERCLGGGRFFKFMAALKTRSANGRGMEPWNAEGMHSDAWLCHGGQRRIYAWLHLRHCRATYLPPSRNRKRPSISLLFRFVYIKIYTHTHRYSPPINASFFPPLSLFRVYGTFISRFLEKEWKRGRNDDIERLNPSMDWSPLFPYLGTCYSFFNTSIKQKKKIRKFRKLYILASLMKRRESCCSMDLYNCLPIPLFSFPPPRFTK